MAIIHLKAGLQLVNQEILIQESAAADTNISLESDATNFTNSHFNY